MIADPWDARLTPGEQAQALEQWAQSITAGRGHVDRSGSLDIDPPEPDLYVSDSEAVLLQRRHDTRHSETWGYAS